MKILLDVPDNIVEQAFLIQRANGLDSVEAALQFILKKGSKEDTVRTQESALESTMRLIAAMPPGKRFTVSQLMRNDPPNWRKSVGCQITRAEPTSKLFKCVGKRNNLNLYERLENDNAPQLP